MYREDYWGSITSGLSILTHKTEMCGSINLLNLNTAAEDFYCQLLNLCFGYELENMNEIASNTASIDLGDKVNRIAFQVTADSSLKKTKKTVNKFIEKKLYEDYDTLIIYNIVKKSSHKEKHIGEPGKFQIDTTNDIWDKSTFLKKIIHKDIDFLEKISLFLDKELKHNTHERISKEVHTINAIIDYLSNSTIEPSSNENFLENPDPDKKINHRFKEYSAYLKTSYLDLVETYGHTYKQILDESDIKPLQLKKVASYLKSHTDFVLDRFNGDPKEALNNLVNQCVSYLKGLNFEYDRTAIEYFLIEEIIKCNVFPNKV
ncbi:MAG: SMEK domain-containing protein [Candidatus Cloacimonetes bacterium]|nr:SMEK domain-containing protein [Candidatus Cloacimonadota bacterium]